MYICNLNYLSLPEMKEKKIKNEQIFKNGLIFLVLVNNEKVQKIRSSVLKNQDPFPPLPFSPEIGTSTTTDMKVYMRVSR